MTSGSNQIQAHLVSSLSAMKCFLKSNTIKLVAAKNMALSWWSLCKLFYFIHVIQAAKLSSTHKTQV